MLKMNTENLRREIISRINIMPEENLSLVKNYIVIVPEHR